MDVHLDGRMEIPPLFCKTSSHLGPLPKIIRLNYSCFTGFYFQRLVSKLDFNTLLIRVQKKEAVKCEREKLLTTYKKGYLITKTK